MLKYIGKRLLYGLLVILGVVTLVFFLFNILPGDPARMMLGQRADAESVEMINRDLGRDKPVGVQFAGYLNDLSPISFHNNRDKDSYWYLDPEKYEPYGTIVKLGATSVVAKMPYLRRSYQSKRKVTEIIATAFPQTAVLALTAMLFAVIVGILLGIVAALHKGSWIDRLTLLLSTLGMSLPSFFAAILIAWFFAYVLSDVTHLNMFGNLYTVDDYGCGAALETVRADLADFLGGKRTLRLAKGDVGGRESYRVDVSPDVVTLTAGDDEGMRRAIYYFEDRVQAGDLASTVRRPWLRHRFSRCFFAPTKRPPLYTDELMDDVDYYPDAYLNRLAREGVNALWITVTFQDLAATSFAPRSPDADRRLAKLELRVGAPRLL